MFTFDGTSWLTSGEQNEVIGHLFTYELINADNARSLPLKMGGTTDIYANLRLMRSKPSAIEYLAQLYANPLKRLRVNRFIEVPEAVSPLAGHLSVITNIPVATFREAEKTGRVTKGHFVGDIRPGDRVAIVDDVVTDGASKLPVLHALRAMGVEVAAIVVLVDRQQGWKKKLAEAGFNNVPVWAGMTLHDVRKYLIRNGLMRRCDPEVEKKNPLIIALDGKPWEDVLPIVDQLRTTGCIFKANDLMLENAAGRMVTDLSVYGRVMVDLKHADISNTIKNFTGRYRDALPWAVTVHASGGHKMLQEAIRQFEGTGTLVLAITLLTSIDEGECEDMYGRKPLSQVRKFAEIVVAAGGNGFVCSAAEIGMIRATYQDATIVVPGLRSPDKEKQDQERVGTFAAAKEAGANYFVGGRQFLQNPDPPTEVRRVLKEELGVDA